MTRGDRTSVTFVFLEKGCQFAGGRRRLCAAAPAVLEEGIDGGIESFVFIEVALGFLESIGEGSGMMMGGR